MPRQKLPTLQVRARASGKFCYARISGREIAFGRADDPETKLRFDRFVGDWIANSRKLEPEPDPASPATASVTVGALLDAYTQHAETYYRHRDGSPTGHAPSVRAAFRELRQLFSGYPAADFRLPHLQTVREHMIANGLARKLINARIGTIRRAFRWGVAQRKVPVAVMAELREIEHLKAGRSGARETAPRGPVSEADMQATLPFLTRHLQALVLALWHSGARCGELVQLRSADVDMSGNTWTFRPRVHKNLWRGDGYEREIDLGPKAIEALRPYVKLDREAYWFSPRQAMAEVLRERRARRKSKPWPSHEHRYRRDRAQRAERRADPAWGEAYIEGDRKGRRPPRDPGDHYDTRTLAHAIRRACKAAGVSPWSPHMLRHAYLTRVKQALGRDAAVACGGHGSPVVTAVYTREADRQLARRAAFQLG